MEHLQTDLWINFDDEIDLDLTVESIQCDPLYKLQDLLQYAKRVPTMMWKARFRARRSAADDFLSDGDF